MAMPGGYGNIFSRLQASLLLSTKDSSLLYASAALQVHDERWAARQKARFPAMLLMWIRRHLICRLQKYGTSEFKYFERMMDQSQRREEASKSGTNVTNAASAMPKAASI